MSDCWTAFFRNVGLNEQSAHSVMLVHDCGGPKKGQETAFWPLIAIETLSARKAVALSVHFITLYKLFPS